MTPDLEQKAAEMFRQSRLDDGLPAVITNDAFYSALASDLRGLNAQPPSASPLTLRTEGAPAA